MFRKPKMRELVKFNLKCGAIVYGTYCKAIDAVSNKVFKTIMPEYPNATASWKDIKSWEYVDTKEKVAEYQEWRQKWITDNKCQLKNSDTEHFNKWVDDIVHIYAIENYVDGLFFADGEIDNPAYFLAKIFEKGYAQALIDVKDALK